MHNNEKIAILEEAWDIDEGTLSESMILDEIDEYDSIAKLSLIVVCEEEFGKKLTGEIIKNFHTVGDILDFMG